MDYLEKLKFLMKQHNLTEYKLAQKADVQRSSGDEKCNTGTQSSHCGIQSSSASYESGRRKTGCQQKYITASGT